MLKTALYKSSKLEASQNACQILRERSKEKFGKYINVKILSLIINYGYKKHYNESLNDR